MTRGSLATRSVSLTLVILLLSMFGAPALFAAEAPVSEEATPTVSVAAPLEEGTSTPDEAPTADAMSVPVDEATATAGAIIEPATNIFGDAYEPDDTYETAGPIDKDGTPQEHTIHLLADEDWVTFEAVAGASYLIMTEPPDFEMDTYIELYDADGVTLLAESGDGGTEYHTEFYYEAVADGPLYARVYADGFSEVGAYTLRVYETGIADPDAYEPDDLSAEANPIDIDGAPQSHTFHVDEDEDWVTFDAIEGQAYVIETMEGSPDIDTEMYLYDADLNELGYSDDDSEVYSYCSRIQYIAPADGPLYVLVHSYYHSESGAYLLSVSRGDGEGDEYEPDDTEVEANPISTDGTAQTHTFHVVDDEDWVTFDAIAGETYVIATAEGSYDVDTEMYLYDADLNELGYDDDGSYSYSYCSRIEYTADADATLYVRVHSYSHSELGTYLLSVGSNGMDEYEPDDTDTEANPISTDGSAQMHTFHVIDDEDWVTFDAIAGRTYTIETAEGSPDVDTEMYLYDADLNELGYSDDDSYDYSYCSRIEYTADTDATLYVRVHSYSHDETGMYLLTVTRSGDPGPADAYEVDDTLVEANPIKVDGTQQAHSFHVDSDEDWVSFEAIAGLTYVIDTRPGDDDLDTYLYLYDADETEIASDDDDGIDYYSHIEYEPTESGTVYVLAHSFSYSSTGNYLLSVDCDDVTAPVTTCDAVATYNTSATIALSANDPAPGVGVEVTYYVLDGGAKQTYTGPITVTSGGAHTLKYWSIDKVTNDETPQTVAFTVVVPTPATNPGTTGGTTTTSGSTSTSGDDATDSDEPTETIVLASAAETPTAGESDDDGEDEAAAETALGTGDEDDTEESDAPSTLIWWIVGGVGLLGLVAFLLKRRK